ncbi:MAG: glutathione-dependent formaldehyde-activating [Verrucomicrobiaceae bacterium]|nr:glutathione-dependent formaldehyde-activating [Verrucomicrobiaceae bacterium]
MWTGRCHCGSIRYELSLPNLYLTLCHCEDCRRSGGGPYQGWIFVPRKYFHLLAGELKVHRYEGRERSFCSDCGSPVTFAESAFPDLVEVSAGTLDEAAKLVPRDNGWMQDHLPWVPVDAALPQFLHTAPTPCLD